jgi:sialic acid synthase SpsE
VCPLKCAGAAADISVEAQVDDGARRVRIGEREIGDGRPCLVVAAIGSNHDGSLPRALALIDAAATAGANAVRFQSFRAATLVARRWPRPGGGWQASEQYPQLERLELPADWHALLRDRARQRGLLFLSTPYDEGRAALLASLGVPAFRVACGDLTHEPLLRALGGYGRPIVLSTGLAGEDEVAQALAAIARGAGSAERCPATVLLQCAVEPFTVDHGVDVRVLPTLRARFACLVGWSDHAPGYVHALAAVALGACVVEKHFTDDHHRAGAEHATSLEPIDFAAMTTAIRRLEGALGCGALGVHPPMPEALCRARRGVYAARSLPAGTVLDATDLKVVRPALGATPAAAAKLVGLRLQRQVAVDEPLGEDECGGKR